MRFAALIAVTLLLAAALLALSVSRLEGFRGVAVIFLGPLPIFIDVSDPSQAILLALPLAIFVLLLILLLLMRRANRVVLE